MDKTPNENVSTQIVKTPDLFRSHNLLNAKEVYFKDKNRYAIALDEELDYGEENCTPKHKIYFTRIMKTGQLN